MLSDMVMGSGMLRTCNVNVLAYGMRCIVLQTCYGRSGAPPEALVSAEPGASGLDVAMTRALLVAPLLAGWASGTSLLCVLLPEGAASLST